MPLYESPTIRPEHLRLIGEAALVDDRRTTLCDGTPLINRNTAPIDSASINERAVADVPVRSGCSERITRHTENGVVRPVEATFARFGSQLDTILRDGGHVMTIDQLTILEQTAASPG